MGFLKRLLCLILCITTVFFLSSCTKDNNNDENLFHFESGFEAGLKKGREETFLSLFNACDFNSEVSLIGGDTWSTEYFTLMFSDEYRDGKLYLNYDLTLKDITINECREFGKLFLNIYYPGESWEPLLVKDDYYWHASPGGLNENRVQGSTVASLPDDGHMCVILILINGHFYYATYTYFVN